MGAQSLQVKRKADLLLRVWWLYLIFQAGLGLSVIFTGSSSAALLVALSVGSAGLVPLWFVVSRARVTGDEAEGAAVLPRSGIELLLGREIVRARRYQRPFSVLIGIVKAPSGVEEERAVEEVVAATQELVRATDEAGAWSKGEVLVILSESTEEQARLLLVRLNAHLKNRLPAIEVRFGVATHTAEDSVGTIVSRAHRSISA